MQGEHDDRYLDNIYLPMLPRLSVITSNDSSVASSPSTCSLPSLPPGPSRNPFIFLKTILMQILDITPPSVTVYIIQCPTLPSPGGGVSRRTGTSDLTCPRHQSRHRHPPALLLAGFIGKGEHPLTPKSNNVYLQKPLNQMFKASVQESYTFWIQQYKMKIF